MKRLKRPSLEDTFMLMFHTGITLLALGAILEFWFLEGFHYPVPTALADIGMALLFVGVILSWTIMLRKKQP